jgi:hypothetical protein
VTAAAALVDRLASALPARTGRRGFLARSAVVGSALATHPLTYLLRPGTAYAAVCTCKGLDCDCGSACCDGYTELCCTITGQNRCPPGSVVAGWWKADTSPEFCGGPRYYLDCNAPCGPCGCGPDGFCGGECSGTGCGCVHGDCNNRAAGCNLFRYGQCSQHIPCVGPILCRVVTCVPPWAIDPTCTTVTLVDEDTAHHDRPCLHEVIGRVDAVEHGGNTTRIIGWALDYDTQAPVTVQAYVHGALVAETPTGAPRPDVERDHPGYGPGRGFVLDVPHPGPAHAICVVARNAGHGEGGADLGCHPVPVRLTGSPYGHLDVAIGGRRTVRVAGWVLDPDRPDATAVHVHVGGRLAGTALAHAARPDVGAAYPRSGPAHGFDVTVVAPPGPQEVCVYGIDIGGGSPNSRIGCRTVTVADGQPFGVVDHLAALPGMVHVRGWALDPDTTSPVPVHVYDGTRLLGGGLANRDRPDVGAAHPGMGAAHGFDLMFTIDGGRRLIRTYAVDVAGSDANALIDERWLDVPAGPPIGVLDIAEGRPGAIRVAGWALDPDTARPIDVHVYTDSRFAGGGRADGSRPDVGRAHPFHGSRHGFDLVLDAAPGFHVVQVYGINQGVPDPNALVGTAWVVVP